MGGSVTGRLWTLSRFHGSGAVRLKNRASLVWAGLTGLGGSNRSNGSTDMILPPGGGEEVSYIFSIFDYQTC